MRSIYKIIVLILFPICLFAQVPQGINYQGIARDLNGTPLLNQTLALKLSIIKGEIEGPTVYEEIHKITTSPRGVFTTIVGQGIASSSEFSELKWGDGNMFLSVSIDIKMNGNYNFLGTSQLLSVPYALYAEKTNIEVSEGLKFEEGVLENTGDISNTNGIQKLSINGNKLSISEGNEIVLPTLRTESLNQMVSNACIMAVDSLGLDPTGAIDHTTQINNFIGANPHTRICFTKGAYKMRVVVGNEDTEFIGLGEDVKIFHDGPGATIGYRENNDGSMVIRNMTVENTFETTAGRSLTIGTRGGKSNRYFKAYEVDFIAQMGSPALDSINAKYYNCTFSIKDDGPVSGLECHSQNAFYQNCDFYGFQVIDAKSGNWMGGTITSTGTYCVHHTAWPDDTDWDGICNFDGTDFYGSSEGFVFGNAPGGHCNIRNFEARGKSFMFNRNEATFLVFNGDIHTASDVFVFSKYETPYYDKFGGTNLIKNTTITTDTGWDFTIPKDKGLGRTFIYQTFFDWDRVLIVDKDGQTDPSYDPRNFLIVKTQIDNFDDQRIAPRSKPPIKARIGRIYMDDGTNTSTGEPILMIWNGSVWKEMHQ